MRAFGLFVVLLGLVWPAGARASSDPDARFLGKRPHGPLAWTLKNTISSPAAGACRTWAKKGSVWSALDTFGRVVGKAKVKSLDRYDVTNCDELELVATSGEGGAGLYVTGDYTPLAIEPWTPSGKVRRELATLIDKRDRRLPSALSKEKDLSLDQRLLAWKTPRGETFAMVGGRGITVLRRTKTAWTVIYRIIPAPAEAQWPDMYMPVGVLDMNADGRVEIVVHLRHIDAYEDFTLSPENGTYRAIDAGISGAFA